MGGASRFRCGAFDDYAAGLPIAASVGDGNHNHKERFGREGHHARSIPRADTKPLTQLHQRKSNESQIRPVMKRSIAITRHSPRPDTATGQVDADPSAV